MAPLRDGVALILDEPLGGQRILTALTHNGSMLPELIDAARGSGLAGSLHLVPECSLTAMPAGFLASERPDSFDYIVDIEAMLSPESSSMKAKHSVADAFTQANPGARIHEVALHDHEAQTALEQIDNAWRAKRNGSQTGTCERRALLRCLALHAEFNTVVLTAADADGTPLGFTVNENLRNGYYMAHFGKTLPMHTGLSEWLELETARAMQRQGCHWMNFQEDHGNSGLRRMKQSWSPCRMLRSYDVRPRG